MSDKLNFLLRKRVAFRLMTGAPYIEGEVIGIYHDPSIIVRLDDGTEKAVSSRLPREVIGADDMGEDPFVTTTITGGFGW